MYADLERAELRDSRYSDLEHCRDCNELKNTQGLLNVPFIELDVGDMEFDTF